MSTLLTTPSSQPPDVLKSDNGVGEDMEPAKSEEKKCEYELEDFSQSIINRHQQYINYELVEVNKATIKALETLRDVVAGLPGGPAIDAVTVAIGEVYKANNKVAGWYPPGCKSGGSASGNTGGTTGEETGGAIQQTS